MAIMTGYAIVARVALLLSLTFAFPQVPASISGLPGTLSWQNAPASWQFDNDNKVLTISAGSQILLFRPDADYILSTNVTVSFATKWDAGALMLWGDDHHWAKLSFELSPDKVPTLVTVVTRGLSDDCNSKELNRDSVYLRIAKTGKTYVFFFSADGHAWQILRTFSLDTEIPVRLGFEAQSPAGVGATAKFSAISYDPHRISNVYK
jgi:regulation of enolase protein 1 (concanavalin A-like superfamily)